MVRRDQSSHMANHLAPPRNFDADGRWSVVSVQLRYLDYCRELGVEDSKLPQPQEHDEDDAHWLLPMMRLVIAGIKKGDKACIALGVDFIEEMDHFAFERILKSNTARALRGAQLSSHAVKRLRKRIVQMLVAGIVPQEFQEYIRLLRHIGVGEWWPTIEQQFPRGNEHVMRHYEYLRKHAAPHK
jgi:hypothetical protein